MDENREHTSTIQTEISVAGILFDMDGVLVRSTRGDERCWERWAAHHGIGDTFDLHRTHGRRGIDTIREHFPGITADELDDHIAQLDFFAEEELSGVEAYPGAIQLLSLIPRHRWTVVTSASGKIMRSRLGAAGITPPEHSIGGDMVSRGKPDPEGYLRGAAILSRRPSECVVIEDAPAGIRAGKQQGAWCSRWHLRTGLTSSEKRTG